MSQKKFYQVGGALEYNAPSYVKRDADKELYYNIKYGEYCYVLKYRQVGKSSLRVHCSNRLESEGFKCVNIDLTSLGTDIKTSNEWYYSFLYEIVDELELSEDIFNDYWDNHSKLTVTSRTELIIDKFILKKCNKKIVIFIDEIDSVLGIKNFSTDDFFALIRRFHILRAEDSRYKRLVFVLLGVASPKDLMEDKTRTPFNIAKDIKMGQLKLEESYKLIDGLNRQTVDKKEILQKVFEYTSGTSYLTQKILDYISKKPITTLDDIENIVDKLFINETFNEINIQTVQGIILENKTHHSKMIYLLAQVLDGHKIKNDSSRRTIIYLKLTGLIKVENNFLEYSNKIYKEIFNHSWLNDMIEKIDRPIAKDLQKWLVSSQKNNCLLEGDVLENINHWADKRDDLSELEHKFLRLSIKREEKKKSEKFKIEKKKAEEKLKIEKNNSEIERKKVEIEKKKAEEKLLETRKKANYKLSMLLFLLLISVIMFGKYYYESKENKLIVRKNMESQQNQIELKLNELILDINPPLEPYREYDISNNKDNKAIEYLIRNSTRLSKEFDKKFWSKNIKFMNKEKQSRLFNILKYYAFMDKGKESNKKNRNNKAIEFYKKAIKHNTKKPDAYIELGKIYYSQREYQKTIEIYKEINPKSKKIYFFIGNSYTKLKKYDKALDYYMKILKEYPNNEKALFNIGDIYIEKKDNEKAISTYKKIIEFNPKSDKALAKIANIYFSQLNYQKAMDFYDKAIENHPNSRSLILSRNLVYKRIEQQNIIHIKNFYKKGLDSTHIGQNNEAIKFFKRAIELNQSDYKIYNALGMAYCKLGKYDKSMEAYNHSKKLNAKDALVYELIGNVEYKLKNSRKAIKSYKKAIELNIKDKNININLHSAYINIFHYQLITFNEIRDKDLERNYVNYFKDKDKKEFFAYYKALKILEKIYKDNKKVDISDWLKEYKNIALDSQDLDYIRKNWVEKIKQNSVRYKLNDMLKKLKGIVPDINYLSFNQAIEKARKEQKLVMVFVNEIGCPWCNKLENLLQTNQEIKRIIYQNFEVVKVEKDDIPMNITIEEDVLPVLLFYKAENKEKIDKLSSIYNVIDVLHENLKEKIAEWRELGYLKNTVKNGKIEKFTREGWVYLGKFKNKKWLKKYFKFDIELKPFDLKDTYQVAKIIVNIRQKGKVSSKKIGGLKIGEEVKIKKTHAIGNDIWAKIKY